MLTINIRRKNTGVFEQLIHRTILLSACKNDRLQVVHPVNNARDHLYQHSDRSWWPDCHYVLIHLRLQLISYLVQAAWLPDYDVGNANHVDGLSCQCQPYK